MPHKQKNNGEGKSAVCSRMRQRRNERTRGRPKGMRISVHHKGVDTPIQSRRGCNILPHERNRVYSAELKRKAAQDYLNGRGSLQSSAVNTKSVHIRNCRRGQGV